MSIAEQRVIVGPRLSGGSYDAAAPRKDSGRTVRGAAERMPFLDGLRAVSAHVIVWHHLVLYGPLSEAMADVAPNLSAFLIEYGRNAVQVFLVIGGFLTAQTLAKRREFHLRDGWSLIRRRYLRIGGPYLCVLAIAVLANWHADRWMDDESISAFPTAGQLFAHAVFLQDLLGYEALSAGVWYLAIDFQLGLIAIAVWWAARKLSAQFGPQTTAFAQGLVWLLAAASLLWINRRPEWDALAIYFFGSYAFGMITAWALSDAAPRWSFWAYAGLMVLALVLEFRPRLSVALATGLIIFGAALGGWLLDFPRSRIVRFAGASSYSLFLIHFPVCLVVNAWLSSSVDSKPLLGAAGLFAAYLLSVLASIGFYLAVERRFAGKESLA